MTEPRYPAEGWRDACASYSLSIIRATVAAIRDRGPLDVVRACNAIVQAGIGADVKKASPSFDEADGARRILNLLVDDIDAIVVRDDGYYVHPDVREVVSAGLESARPGRSFAVPSAEELTADRARSARAMHLTRWLGDRPFATVWRDHIREHDNEAVLEMAERILAVGYDDSFPIVVDQHNVIMNGHLRALALDLLERPVEPHIQTLHFVNDRQRLAYIINAHWPMPPKLRDEIVRVVSLPMKGQGRRGGEGTRRDAKGKADNKMRWPDEIAMVVGDFGPPTPIDGPAVRGGRDDEIVAPPAVAVDAEPKELHRPSGNRFRCLRQYLNGPKTDDEVCAALPGAKQSTVVSTLSQLTKDGYLHFAAKRVAGRQTPRALTDAGRDAARKPWRPKPSKPSEPGMRVSSGARLAAVNHLLRASTFGAGEWVKRDVLHSVAEADKVLRRAMWFRLADRTAYMVVPDTLDEDWTRMRVRRLHSTEEAELNDRPLEDQQEFWEALVQELWEALAGD